MRKFAPRPKGEGLLFSNMDENVMFCGAILGAFLGMDEWRRVTRNKGWNDGAERLSHEVAIG